MPTKEQLKEYRTKRIQEFAETRRKATEECKEDSKICVSRKKFFELAQAEIQSAYPSGSYCRTKNQP